MLLLEKEEEEEEEVLVDDIAKSSTATAPESLVTAKTSRVSPGYRTFTQERKILRVSIRVINFMRVCGSSGTSSSSSSSFFATDVASMRMMRYISIVPPERNIATS